jgi:hypothetical protein
MYGAAIAWSEHCYRTCCLQASLQQAARTLDDIAGQVLQQAPGAAGEVAPSVLSRSMQHAQCAAPLYDSCHLQATWFHVFCVLCVMFQVYSLCSTMYSWLLVGVRLACCAIQVYHLRCYSFLRSMPAAGCIMSAGVALFVTPHVQTIPSGRCACTAYDAVCTNQDMHVPGCSDVAA